MKNDSLLKRDPCNDLLETYINDNERTFSHHSIYPIIKDKQGSLLNERGGFTMNRTPFIEKYRTSFLLLQGTHVATKYKGHASTCKHHMRAHFTKRT